MESVFINNHSHNTIILFHGTGQDEKSLIPMVNLIDSNANILSIRGEVLENGNPRYFRRYSINVFDYKSIANESHKIKQYIENFILKNRLSMTKITLMGFSNGANMVESLIQRYPSICDNACLILPTYLEPNRGFSDLHNKNILITSATNDIYTTKQLIDKLEYDIKQKGAKLDAFCFDSNHEINDQMLKTIKKWYIRVKG